jgi:hypothetical protein
MSCFISDEAQKSSEGKQRCPLNGRVPIHVVVLKAATGLKQQKQANQDVIVVYCDENCGYLMMLESHPCRKIFVSVQTNVGQINVHYL